ncbi:RNA recognition motif domain-containing protein [Pseudobacter ginsenosidimutans]|uniref:RNA recognition motif-containing protein n=1 Tax=Pseudobacter ginsenosidimutans TaxID=661488 RepID=A0A4Q7N484_9BACT|nr:RNA-binding protein [Pseudobacter ginsenosidimutans]QEC44328.1 RNA-binding protein [Pseudobacter ginsenosidimutans]RZS75790.1 RNA recognition motif-containing protein [Pseudobacter ginsenosidimutans]
MTIQVHNLSADMTDRQLRKIFETFGVVVTATVSRNQFNGRSNRHGLVEMLKLADGENAINSLDRSIIDGKIISVSVSNEY